MTTEPAAPASAGPIDPLPLGATIGIFGGGQLGRMLAMAAHRLGLNAHIYCPDPDSPAFDVTPLRTIAAYDDADALRSFALAVDAATWEFENVPASIRNHREVPARFRGSSEALSVAQDRLDEKRFLEGIGLPVAPWQVFDSVDDLEIALAAVGTPAVLKTRRLGYDGKGQQRIDERTDLQSAFNGLAGAPAILEGFVPFEREASVILARGADGATAAFDPVENVHENHILRTSTVPATIAPDTAEAAVAAAATLASALDYVGVIGVEFFITGGEKPLLVNEFAPRVHNSGHWTEAACAVSQFEQHIRAVAGWPLGDPSRFADAVMTNLIGDEVLEAPKSAPPGTSVQLYGKREIRPGRKMGHTVALRPLTR